MFQSFVRPSVTYGPGSTGTPLCAAGVVAAGVVAGVVAGAFTGGCFVGAVRG
jgi:hypothetical protein